MFWIRSKNHDPKQEDMSTSKQRKGILQRKIDEGYAILDSDRDKIPDRIYNAIEGISSTMLAYKYGKGQPGWSQVLVDQKGGKLFTEQESHDLEKAAKTIEPFLNNVLLEGAAMVGGADFSNMKAGMDNEMIQPPSGVDPGSLSFDKLYYDFLKKLEDSDTYWRAIADQMGVVKTFEEQDAKGIIMLPTVPPIPIPYLIPAKAKLPLVNALLESLRLLVSNPVIDIGAFRMLFSFLLAILDLLRGEWKNALLSFLGAWSQNAMYIGIVGKLVRNAWLLIAPDLQHDIQRVLFDSTKSFIVGFFLWAFSIFSPDAIRMVIQQSVDKAREMVAQFNEQIAGLEQQAQAAASAAGVDVSFKRIPEDMIPSLEDIQNLQTLLRIPSVVCSNEFKGIIGPMSAVPPLRLVLELFGVPTDPEIQAKICEGVNPELSSAITDVMTPTVTAKGGEEKEEDPAAESPAAAAEDSTPTPQAGGRAFIQRRKTRKAKRFSGEK